MTQDTPVATLDGSPTTLTLTNEGLQVHPKNTAAIANTENSTVPVVIPHKEIIALLPPSTAAQNKTHILLHTNSYKAGKPLHITNPPKALVDNYLYNPASPPAWLDLSSGKAELSVILSTNAGAPGGTEETYNKTVKPLLQTYLGLAEHVWTGPVHSDKQQALKKGYNLIKTTSATSIQEYASSLFRPSSSNDALREEGAHERHQTIILLSGDTSLFELINSLPHAHSSSPNSQPRTTILPLPTGSGNAFATSTYPHTHPLTPFLLGTPHTLPLIKASFPPETSLLKSTSLPLPLNATLYATVVLSWCFHAALVADSDTPYYREKYPGNARFQVAARENLLPKPHLYNGRIQVKDGGNGGQWTDLRGGQAEMQKTKKGLWYFLATMVSNLEPTFPISPLSKPLDSKLRIVHFGDDIVSSSPKGGVKEEGGEAAALMDVMKAVYDSGKHISLPNVGYARDGVDAVRIELDEEDYVPDVQGGPHDENRWRRICIDGAIVEVEKDGWAEVSRMERGLEGLNIFWRGSFEL